MYNPSRAAQESFRDSLLQLLPQRYHPTIVDDGISDDEMVQVLFPEHEFLHLSVVFRMKRPLSHFVGNRPGPGRLKPSAPGRLHPTRSDVDNLAKFVMDSLNGLLYVDDRQVASLHATKVLDAEGDCRGATDVRIRVLTEEDLHDVME
ncbi:hypothetical protein ACHAXT_010428 [Thalassiosira profunda]